MRIDRLHVKNFKGFEDHVFDFPRSIDAPPGGNGSFHLIIGQNGRGKTSVLDALAVAAGSWLLGVSGVISRHIKEEDIRLRIMEFEGTERIEPQLPVTVEAEGVAVGKPLRWKRTVESKRTRWLGPKSIKSLAEDSVRRMRADDRTLILPLISYYGTGRLWQEPREMRERGEEKYPKPNGEEDLAKAFASRLDGYRLSIDPRCDPKELLRWLKFEQQLAVQENRESNQFRLVKEAIRQAVEGCSKVEFHLRLGLLLEIEGQQRLPFGALSDGQRNMVALVGDLAYKAAQLNPNLGTDVLQKTPGIVLIDELDLHLHPRWQRHVAEDLRRIFPEIQFVATTHSPFIVQAMRSEELISLDGQTVPDTAHLGVEEIARGLMDVPNPEVSPRYREMKAVAKDYLVTLEEARLAPEEKLAEYEKRLSEGIGPYSDNPAFQALLELKREAVLGGRHTENGTGHQ